MKRTLPAGFKRAFRGLLAQGYKPKDAMREAWRIYRGTAPGMRKQKLNKRRSRKNPRSRGQHFMDSMVTGAAMGLGSGIAGKIIPNPKRRKRKKTRKRNPGYRYHTREAAIEGERAFTSRTEGQRAFHRGKAAAHSQSAFESKKLGINHGRKNPIAIYNPRGTLLYGQITEIKGMKTSGAHRGQGFRHPFETPVKAIGLKDGSVLLKGIKGQRLWDFEDNI